MSEYQWKDVSVVGFDELMQALERADRKGHMPDVIKEEWEAFNWKPAQQEPGRNHYEDGDVFERIAAMKRQPAQQEPVAWLTEERYAEMHTSKWTPKIQQVFSKDGILESQTIQYAPQSKPVPYPPAQRTWVGLTDDERNHARQTVTYSQLAMTAAEWAEAVQIETEKRLKEKNT